MPAAVEPTFFGRRHLKNADERLAKGKERNRSNAEKEQQGCLLIAETSCEMRNLFSTAICS
jgi:hypothetical protein